MQCRDDWWSCHAEQELEVRINVDMYCIHLCWVRDAAAGCSSCTPITRWDAVQRPPLTASEESRVAMCDFTQKVLKINESLVFVLPVCRPGTPGNIRRMLWVRITRTRSAQIYSSRQIFHSPQRT